MAVTQNTAYAEAFKEHICTKCTICHSPINPSFCTMHYIGNKGRFLKLLSYIMALRISSPPLFKNLMSFIGFCGVYCNSIKPCPHYSKDTCIKIETRIKCYTAFIGQCGAELTTKVKLDIFASFANTESGKIGMALYGTPEDPISIVEKKKRKKIKKAIKKARAGMMRAVMVIPITYKKKPKKKVTTTFFCNDDEEWKTKIEEYLAR